MDSLVAQLAREVFALDEDASGKVHISMPEFIATKFITPNLRQFCSQYPNIQLELALTNQILNLTYRETDIAVRLSKNPPTDAIARKLATSPLCTYVSNKHINDTNILKRWVALNYEPALAMTKVESAQITLSGLDAAAQAIEEGLGQGVLPCFVGDSMSSLTRVPGAQPKPDIDLWLLVHPDMRKVKRVREVSYFIIELFNKYQPLIEGLLPANTV